MKRSALLLLFVISIFSVSASEVLLEFGRNKFDGWVYTQSSTELNNSTIGQDLISLFGDYALISPEFTAPNVKSITVNVTGRNKGYDDPEYSNSKGKVYVQLINDNDSLLKDVKYTFSTKEFERNFEVDFDISDITTIPLRLRFACWNADIPSRFSVKNVLVTVKEYNLSGVVGDVNNDGAVTSADVTAIYDFLLNSDTSSIISGDVNNDGNITAADVTAIYNILLGVEENF